MEKPLLKADRVHGLDVGRTIAILTVVFGHAQVQVPVTTAYDILARFAVPFFFILSGYFIKLPSASLPTVLFRLTLGIMTPFVIWLPIYLLWFQPGYDAFTSPIYLIKLAVQGGPAHHLWFLPSLAVSAAFLLTLLYLGVRTSGIVAAGIAFYLIGLVLGPYYEVLIAPGDFFWNMRNGPFFGFPFIVLGWFLARRQAAPDLRVALGILAIGAVWHALEILTLDQFGIRFEHDLLIGTVPYAVGFFLVMLAWPQTRAGAILARLGPYSLGIYCVHLLMIEIAKFRLGIPFANEAPYTIGLIAATGSILLSVLVARIPGLKSLVRTVPRTKRRKPVSDRDHPKNRSQLAHGQA